MPKRVDHAVRRDGIIDAARAIIMERGIDRTTVRLIAQRAGFTTGALVHYFGGKSELIRQTLERFGHEVRGEMRTIGERHRGREGLRLLLQAALPIEADARGRWQVWMEMWEGADGSAMLRDEVNSRYAEWIGRVTLFIEQSIEDGELPEATDVRLEAERLVALIDGLGIQHLMNLGSGSPERMTQQLEVTLERLYDDPG